MGSFACGIFWMMLAMINLGILAPSTLVGLFCLFMMCLTFVNMYFQIKKLADKAEQNNGNQRGEDSSSCK